jgi:hypothetical protein
MIFWHLACLLHAAAADQRFQFRNDDYIQYRTVSFKSLSAIHSNTYRLMMLQLPNRRIIKLNITYYDRAAVAPG